MTKEQLLLKIIKLWYAYCGDFDLSDIISQEDIAAGLKFFYKGNPSLEQIDCDIGNLFKELHKLCDSD